MIISLFLSFVSLSGIMAQRYVGAASYLFSFPEKRDLFLADYGDNAFALQSMNAGVQEARAALIEGRYHILIVSHVGAYDFEDGAILNEASLRASRIRAYIKLKLNIPHACTVFYIDRSGNYRNQVHVYLVKSAIPWFANQEILYCETPAPVSLEQLTHAYGAIPYVDLYLRNSSDGTERLIYSITDSLFQKEELDDYRLMTETNVDTLTLAEEHFQSQEPNLDGKYFSSALVPLPMQEVSHVSAGFCTSMLAVKTNLLPWCTVVPSVMLGNGSVQMERGACMPNLALEYYFARRWSVEASALYAAFPYGGVPDSRWAVSAFSLEPRIWPLAGGSFCGLHIGVSGQYGDFDVFDGERGRTGRFCSGMLTLGYLKSFSQRLCAEVSAGAGYRSVSGGTTYRKDTEGVNYAVSRFNRSGFLLAVRLNILYRFEFR